MKNLEIIDNLTFDRLAAIIAAGSLALGSLTYFSDSKDAFANTKANGAISTEFGASGAINEYSITSAGLDTLEQGVDGIGIGFIRSDATWANVQPNPPVNGENVYDWTSTDATMSTIASQDLRWQPILDYNTAWDSSDNDSLSEPLNPNEFADYAQAFMERYGPNGTYWQENPNIPYLPVTSVEIWNEENNGGIAAIPPADYWQLYSLSRAAIKKIDPNVQVILGGVLDIGDGTGQAYLQAIEQAFPGSLASADAIGFHPYETTPASMINAVVALRAYLNSIGATFVPISLNEFDFGPFLGNSQVWANGIAQVVEDLGNSNCNVSQISPYDLQSMNNNTDIDPNGWYALVSPNGDATDIGESYLMAINSLFSSPSGIQNLCTITLTTHFKTTETIGTVHSNTNQTNNPKQHRGKHHKTKKHHHKKK